MNASEMQKGVRVITEKNYVPANETYRVFPSSPEEEIVISGVAGRYPSCDNVQEFSHHLFNKVGVSQNAFFI